MSWKKKLPHHIEKADIVGSGIELYNHHTPLGLPVSGYNWGTNKIIKNLTPPNVFNDPGVQRVLKARKFGLMAFGATLTMAGLYSIFKARKDGSGHH